MQLWCACSGDRVEAIALERRGKGNCSGRVGLYRLYKGYVEVEASTRVKTVEPPL
jgi:hypothetical protein